MQFFDRADELAALEARWPPRRGELLVVWGRRRVGKTELLSHFLGDRAGLLFESTEGLEPDHLRDLSSLLAEKSGRPLLMEQSLTTWAAALAAIEEFTAAGPAIVILDEFQWIARATTDIGSQLNRWWRQRGRDLPLILILSGSEVSFFERDVLTGAMFGRRTGQQQVAPFGYRDAGRFFPSWTPEARIRAYAVCGGMPYYLEQFDERLGLGDNILRSMLYRDGVLFEEARLLLHEELADPARHFSILRAIANGATRRNEIQMRTRIGDPMLQDALRTLQSLYLVQRRVPVTARNPDRTRLTSYAITDGYLRFYFRFVHPFESRLQTRDGAERHLHEVVLPNLDEFVSRPAFEEVCHQYLQRVENAAAVGSWWGSVRLGGRSAVREIDGVAIDGDGRVRAIATCKWTRGAVPASENDRLTEVEPAVPETTPATRRYFFARSGFSKTLRALAEAEPDRYRLVAPRDLFDG